MKQKIRQSIPFLKEEYEAFEDGSIDRDMITPIMLNHVLEYCDDCEIGIDSRDGELLNLDTDDIRAIYDCYPKWNLKSAYLKDQSEELITFLNDLK